MRNIPKWKPVETPQIIANVTFRKSRKDLVKQIVESLRGICASPSGAVSVQREGACLTQPSTTRHRVTVIYCCVLPHPSAAPFTHLHPGNRSCNPLIPNVVKALPIIYAAPVVSLISYSYIDRCKNVCVWILLLTVLFLLICLLKQ